MLWDVFKIVVARIRSRSRHTVLTCAGVGIGTATLMFFANLATSLTDAVEDRLSALGAHTFTVAPQPTPGRQPAAISVDDVNALRRSIASIESASAVVQFRARIKACGGALSAHVVAASPIHHEIARHRPATGRLLNPIDLRGKRAVAVVSQQVAAKLRCLQESNSHLFVGSQGFDVVGTLEADSSAELAEAIFVPLTTLQARVGARIEGAISIIAEARRDVPLDYVTGQVRALLRRRHAIPPDAADDFTIQTRDNVKAEAIQLSSQAKWLLGVVVAWSLLIAGVGIANSVFSGVLERIPQIGLQRAIGAKRRHIRFEYLLEAACLSGTGALAGVALGAVVFAALAAALDLPQTFDIQYGVLGAVGGIGLGIVAGTWPAMYAAALNPAASMRAE